MITSEKMQEAILGALGEREQEVIQRVTLAGRKVLFDPNTHKPLFESLNKSEGFGVAQLMLLLFDRSKKSIPKGALIPAGAILLVKALEFTEKAGIKKVDDGMLTIELQKMIVKIMDRFDKTFKDKVAQKTGQAQPQEQPPAQQQPIQQPSSGGLINAIGA